MDKKILIRFLNGESSPEEASRVKAWLDMPGSQEKLDELLRESWEDAPASDDDEAVHRVLSSIHRKINGDKKSGGRLKGFLFYRLAAVFVVFGFLVFAAYKFIDLSTPVEKEELVLFSRTTKAGEKLKIRLPDSTYVVLNANSTMEFDSDFGKEARKVHVSGEAFFEVASIKDVPFVVHSGDLVTTAVGTEFNVYSRGGVQRIALTEGKVKVELDSPESDPSSAHFLTPGSMASFDEAQQKLTVEEFDQLELTAWKEGRIRFRRKNLGEILDNLQTWYGVEITASDRVNLNRRVTGEFNNDNLESILQGLSFSLDFKFSINENQVELTK